MRFTWISYYRELADRLMQFRHDRKPLLKLIYEHREELLAKYLHDQDGEDDLLTDIDPFTVFGLFNRGIKDENKLKSANLFKRLFDIKADVPSDFKGIPILNNRKSYFFGYKRNKRKGDIENLWTLFERVINNEDFDLEFDKVIEQYGINVNITMGLFWIRPNDYLSFDRTNRIYLSETYGIIIPSSVPDCKKYRQIVNNLLVELN